MRNKKIFVIFLVFIFGAIFLIQPVTANGSTMTISTIAEKDSYVDTYSPGANFGGVNYLYAGIDYSYDLKESYFYFNFSDKPSNYKKAEISLDIWGVSKTVYLNVCLIEESWDEYTITWMNKPEYGEHITTLLVPSSNIYKIDITNYIEGRNNISICLYTGDYLMDDYIFINSREGYYSWAPEDAPQLIWTYETEPPNQPPTATIDSITPNPAEQGVDTISFSGYGIDTDGTIVAYEWSSSKDGVLSSLSSFNKSASDFSVGTHTIYFKVKDNDGVWSSKVSEILTIMIYGNDDGNDDSNGNGEPEPEPDIIAGFNLLILLGIIGIATPILIKKIKK